MALEKSPERGRLLKETKKFAPNWSSVPRGLSRIMRLIRTGELSISYLESVSGVHRAHFLNPIEYERSIRKVDESDKSIETHRVIAIMAQRCLWRN